VAQIALGRSNEDEFKDNLCQVSKKLTGDAGLLMTNRTKKEVFDDIALIFRKHKK
jgi:mRNA turnover protein 4